MGCGASSGKKKNDPSGTLEPDVENDGVYRPFRRGAIPVGCRTVTVPDPSRDGRALLVECYYPATDGYFRIDITKDKDKKLEAKRRKKEADELKEKAKKEGKEYVPREYADAEQDKFVPAEEFSKDEQLFSAQAAVRDAITDRSHGQLPIVVFSHGEFEHRRSCSHVCTHLASHGYAVFAVDHPGDCFADLLHDIKKKCKTGDGKARLRPDTRLADRVADFEFLETAIREGKCGLDPGMLRLDDFAVTGHGIGGTAALVYAKKSERVRAAVALGPNAGAEPLRSEEVADKLGDPMEQSTPTLILAADSDSFSPINALREEFKKHSEAARKYIPPPLTKMLIMESTDHYHFLTHPSYSQEAALHPQWAARVCESVDGAGDEIELDYDAVADNIRPLNTLLPIGNVHAVLMTCVTAFFDAHLSSNDDTMDQAFDFVEKIFEGKMYNVNMEVVNGEVPPSD